MPFFRDYAPKFEQSLEDFIGWIQQELQKNWYAIRKNSAPYNRMWWNNKRYKLDHITIFYNENLQDWELGYMIRDYKRRGYSYQEVATEIKSIPNIDHVHMIKILWEDNTFNYPV